MSIVAIVTVCYILSGPTHHGSQLVVRLIAAVIVTAFAAVAKFVAGPRAAAGMAIVGVLVVVVLLDQLA